MPIIDPYFSIITTIHLVNNNNKKKLMTVQYINKAYLKVYILYIRNKLTTVCKKLTHFLHHEFY